MKNKFILGVVFFTLAVFCAGSVLAQEAGNSQEESNASKEDRANPEEGRLVATVNFYVVEIKNPGNNEFEITFAANNAENVQPGIRYAISLQREKDSHQEVFARKVYDEVLSLGPGETVERTVKYSAPKNLSGEFDLFLESASTDGLILGMANGGKVEIEGSGQDQNNFSENIESLDSESSQSQYIVNVRFDKDYYSKGDTAKIILDTMPFQIEAGKINLFITDKDQESCLEEDFQENDFTGEKNGVNELAAKIAKDCANPVFQLSIKGKNGEVVDEGKYAVESKSEDAKNAMVKNKTKTKAKTIGTVYSAVAIGVIIFALVALIYLIIRKIKYRNYHTRLFLLIFGTSLIFFSSSVEAHTYVWYTGNEYQPQNQMTYVTNYDNPPRESGTAYYDPDDLNSDGSVTRKGNASVTRKLIAGSKCGGACDPSVTTYSIEQAFNLPTSVKIVLNKYGYDYHYKLEYLQLSKTVIDSNLVLGKAEIGQSATVSATYEIKDYNKPIGFYGEQSFAKSAIKASYFLNGKSLPDYGSSYVPVYLISDGFYLKEPLAVCSDDLELEEIHCGGCGSVGQDLALARACKYGQGEDFSMSNFSTSAAKATWKCVSNASGGVDTNCSQGVQWVSKCSTFANKPICNLSKSKVMDDYKGFSFCGYESSALENLIDAYWGLPKRYNPGYADILPAHASNFKPSSFLMAGTWSWTCNGFGGTQTNCKTAPGTMAACGSSVNSSTYPTDPCSVGVTGRGDILSNVSPQFDNITGTWQWSCTIERGVQLGCDVSCSTPGGGCVSDSANMKYYANTPSGNQLCFVGGTLEGSVSGNGTSSSPWKWSCRDSAGQLHNNCEAKKIDAVLKVDDSENSPALVEYGNNANFSWSSENADQCRRYASSADSNWTSNWSGSVLNKNSSKNFQPVNGRVYYFRCRAYGSGRYASAYYEDTASITVNVSTTSPFCGMAVNNTYCSSEPTLDLCVNNTIAPSIIDKSDPSKFKWTCSTASTTVSCEAKKRCSTDNVWREIAP